MKKNTDAVSLGRLGGLKGGKARAEALSPEQRTAAAKHAAAARWSPPATPCSKCGSLRCRAFLERICKGRHSYDCMRRIVYQQRLAISALKHRISDLESDPGRWTNCADCGCELVTSATRCAKCLGVDPVE